MPFDHYRCTVIWSQKKPVFCPPCINGNLTENLHPLLRACLSAPPCHSSTQIARSTCNSNICNWAVNDNIAINKAKPILDVQMPYIATDLRFIEYVVCLYLAPPESVDPVGISWRCLLLIKLDDWATVRWKHYDIMLSRFHPIPERHRWTNRQTYERTDRIPISISRVTQVESQVCSLLE